MKADVEQSLGLAVCQHEEQGLHPEHAPVGDMREYPSQEFEAASAFRHVGVVYHEAKDPVHRFGALVDPVQQLPGDAVHDLAPVDVAVAHESVEHVAAATEHVGKAAFGEVVYAFDQIHGEQDHKIEYLPVRELAVDILDRTDGPVLDPERFHHAENGLYRPVSVVFQKNALQFRNNMYIFVHGLRVVCYLFLLLKVSDNQ